MAHNSWETCFPGGRDETNDREDQMMHDAPECSCARLSYDMLAGAFLSKVTEFDFIRMDEFSRDEVIIGYMKRAVSEFRKNCKYNLVGSYLEDIREFDVFVRQDDIDEIINIISEGMLIQWMKPYLYKQENLSNVLNTRDYSTYSPAELLNRIGSAYARVQKDYTQMIREYSYNHNDLSDLHI